MTVNNILLYNSFTWVLRVANWQVSTNQYLYNTVYTKGYFKRIPVIYSAAHIGLRLRLYTYNVSDDNKAHMPV